MALRLHVRMWRPCAALLCQVLSPAVIRIRTRRRCKYMLLIFYPRTSPCCHKCKTNCNR